MSAPWAQVPQLGGNWGGSCSSGLSAGTSPSYGSGGYPGDTELLTTFSWDDRNVRRVFIRKVRQGHVPHPLGWQGWTPGPWRASLCWALGSMDHHLSLQVYAILMVQLLVTVVIVAFFTFWWVLGVS